MSTIVRRSLPIFGGLMDSCYYTYNFSHNLPNITVDGVVTIDLSLSIFRSPWSRVIETDDGDQELVH